ncbi:RHS repeat-associated core domain containing protein [Nitzschia inconspicua]|uniref:RHS repeat-associated core domain containing protein n=1 Tax=Nitzschia inconspicua TaxID=303405 RepID=A0A9K3L1Q2_9STRA|nr:RHS repeat-associated core domain containing protein [Nitzschia inconspicua]
MVDVNDEDDSYRFSSTSMKKNKPRQLRIKKTLVADDEEDNGPSNAIPPPTRPMQQQQQQPPQLSPNQPQTVPVNTAKASPSPALVGSDGSSPSSSSSSSQRHKRFHRTSSSSSGSAKSPLPAGVPRSRFSPPWDSQSSRGGKKTSTTTATKTTAPTATQYPQRVGRSPPSRTKESIADDTEVFDLHAPTMYNSYRRRSRSRSQGDRVQDAVGEGQAAESSSVSLTSSSSSSNSGEETYEKYRKYLSTNDGNDKEDAAPWRKAQSQKKPTMKIGAPPPLEYSYRYSASEQQTREKEVIASPTLESNNKRRKSNSPRDRLKSNRIPQEDLEMVEIMLLGSSSEEDDSSTESPIPHQFVDGTTSEEDTSMGLQLEASSSHGSSSHQKQQSHSTAEPSQRADHVMVKSEGKPSSGLGPLAMENGTERRSPNETSKQVPLRDSIQPQRLETHTLKDNAAPYRGKELALGNRADEGATSDTGATETKKDIQNIAFTTGISPEGIYDEGVGRNEEKVPKAGGLQSTKTPPPLVQTEEQSGTVQDRIKQLEANSKLASTAVFQAEKNIGIIPGESTIEEAEISESVDGDIVDMWETSVLEESKDVLEESFGQHSKRRGMTLLNSSRLSIGSRGSRRTQTQSDSLSQKSFGDSYSLRESDGDSVPLQPMGKMEEGNSSISKSTGLALASSGRYDVMTPSLAMSHLAGLNQPKQNDDSDSSASLGSDEVFDPAPKVLVSKPLLAAAVKGKQESESNAQYGSHLEGLNQPKQNDDSDSSASLGSDEVFDPAPKVLDSKPLLAAAVKGKQESETSAQYGSHLEGLNQPKQNDDSDSSASLGSDEVFDPAPKVLVSKPLLAAAVKGKQESETSAQYGLHLEGLNQPKQNDDSDSSASLGSDEVFDPAPKVLVSKPLLAAAVKGKQESEANAQYGLHLEGLNQPKQNDDSDSSASLGSDEVFDPAPKVLVSKPLLAAAVKGKQESESNAQYGSHLEGLNQPKQNDDSDSSASLGSDEVFDPAPKVFISKPLLAAAVKGKQESETNAQYGSHLEGLNQPKQNDDSDSSASLGSVDPAPKVLVSKPLLAAAVKGKQESESNAQYGSHLEGLNQPKQNDDSDSNASLGSGKVLDSAPKGLVSKPLVAAAVKGKKGSQTEIDNGRQVHAMPSGAHPHTNHQDMGSSQQLLTPGVFESDSEDSSDSVAIGGILAMLEDDKSDEFSYQASHDISKDHGSISENSDYDHNKVRNKGYDDDFMNHGLHNLNASLSEHDPEEQMEPLVQSSELHSDSDSDSDSNSDSSSSANVVAEKLIASSKSPSKAPEFFRCCSRGSIVLLLFAAIGLPLYFLVWYNDGDNGSTLPTETVPPLFPPLSPITPTIPVADPSSPPMSGPTQDSPTESPLPLPSFPTTSGPSGTSMHGSAEEARELLVNKWPSLEEDWGDVRTPQFLALDWLTNDPNLDQYTEERILQRFSLATLYFSTDGDNWRRNDRWLSMENECLWYSAGSSLPCDDNLIYTALNLDLNGLSGTIPSELALLSNSLTRINFSSRRSDTASLSGTIPNELGFLSLLEDVDFSGNELQGSIPVGLGKWSVIRSINLSDNLLGGSLPFSITHWTSLTFLDIGNNSLESSVPSSIGLLTNLRQLNLSGNSFTGAVPSHVGRLNLLQVLYLQENQFTELPTEIGRLVLLQQFFANGNTIAGPIPTEIGRLMNLLSLNLSQNVMAGKLPTELGRLISIRDELNLSENLLSGPLPTELGRLIFLRNLLLQSNRLTGSVPSTFARLNRLISLRLEDNSLTGTVPDNVCDVYDQTYPIFVTDCLNDDEIICDCCMFCCQDGGGCECQFANTDLSFLCAEFTESPGLEQRIFGDMRY